MTSYERLKRYRQKQSLYREEMYLAKLWPPAYRFWNAHQWAAVKRWCIYYHRRRQERELGFKLPPSLPRHWVSRAEGERKRRNINRSSGATGRLPDNRGTWNPVALRHWLRF